MSRKSKRKFPIYKNVEIIDLATEKRAVGKVKIEDSDNTELIIFVEKTVPGDIVDVKVTKKKKSYLEAYPLNFIKYSDKRIDPFCKHFNICGGCTRQQLKYEDQLFYKQKSVNETLKRISKAKLPDINDILPSPDIKYYRNKLEYTFSNSRWLTENEVKSDIEITNFKGLGFHIPGRYDKVLDIEECFLQRSPSNDIRLYIKEFAVKNHFDFFNLYKIEGFLRNLIIRTSTNGEIMIIVSFFKDETQKIYDLLDAVSEKFPEITSVNYVINSKGNDTITDLEIIHYKGKKHLNENMDDIKFRIGPKSFYQTNSIQAYNLYKIVKEYGALKSDDIVYDLYTGTGTIANFIAKDVKKVIGIEYVEESIKDAIINSDINNIKNTLFFAGDMKDILTEEFTDKHGKPDLIITDPPRSGMHKKVIDTIVKAAPEKIIYVSCNVATQARDLEILKTEYNVEAIQPIDMFPHTHHVENVLLLKKR